VRTARTLLASCALLLASAGCLEDLGLIDGPDPEPREHGTVERDGDTWFSTNFEEDPLSGGDWRLAAWSPKPIRGGHSMDGVGLELWTQPGGYQYGFRHAVEAGASCIRMEATVIGLTLHRFGIHLDDNGKWLDLELDDDGVILGYHDAGGRYQDQVLLPTVYPDRPYQLSLSLHADGTAEAVVTVDGIARAHVLETDIVARAAGVHDASLNVWTDFDHSPASRYRVTDFMVLRADDVGNPDPCSLADVG
jgi:hypothetical protein